MARWNKTGKWKRATAERLLERDGRNCWLCARPLTLPPKRPSERITLEHLHPRSLGGGDSDGNLVLCHQHCNAHLRDRPLEKKQGMRKKWHAVEQARRSPSK